MSDQLWRAPSRARSASSSAPAPAQLRRRPEHREVRALERHAGAVRLEPARIGAVDVAQRAVAGDVRADTAERREEGALRGRERRRGIAVRRDEREAAAHDVVEAAAPPVRSTRPWTKSEPAAGHAASQQPGPIVGEGAGVVSPVARAAGTMRASRSAASRGSAMQITRPSATEKSIVARACGARSLA